MKRRGFIVLTIIFGTFFILVISLKKFSNPVFTPQPVFGELKSDFQFSDYKGNIINSCSLNDNIVLYNFLSVKCPTDFEKCPFRLEWFKIKIYSEMVNNIGFKDLRVVTSFIDDDDDLDIKIRDFREYHNIKSDKWIMTSNAYIPYFDNNFKNGNPWNQADTNYNFQRQAYLMTLLVDKNQKIRGKYLTYDFGEVRRITKEISLIIREEMSQEDNELLPIYGNKDFDSSIDKDTVYHTIPFWSFMNQNGKEINSIQYANKVCLVDFFFTHCPTICPRMTLNMREVQIQLEKDCLSNVELLSFTVDPKRDSIDRLKEYSTSYETKDNNWSFLTGNQNEIYELGVNGYLVPNQEDALAPGGFLHSEKLILIDKKGRIRGYYDGTNSENIATIVQHIKQLNQE
jgi:protein SCO1/2